MLHGLAILIADSLADVKTTIAHDTLFATLLVVYHVVALPHPAFGHRIILFAIIGAVFAWRIAQLRIFRRCFSLASFGDRYLLDAILAASVLANEFHSVSRSVLPKCFQRVPNGTVQQ